MTFLEAAIEANIFTQAHLYNSTGAFINDGVFLADCSRGGPITTYDTGLYLEALSVFANSTKNSTLARMADELALAAMKSTFWTLPNGTLFDPGAPTNVSDNSHVNTAYKGMLIRALYEHWTRSEPNSDISNLIKAFLMVQYNAALSFARSPDTNIYTYSWTGPPATSMLPWGQLATADI
ncbi:hypothetical protein QCA50_008126 [Cerrena zonata]|uniref:Uncharacterized protein n=1 Tax=Cerrena zonata TaxID=2478898 RepID=A0AAW0G5M1_9APHY